jgi:hypothetical protein
MARAAGARVVPSRFLLRLAAVLCLLLAALLLGADAGEYPGHSRAGVRALVRGPVPLLLVAALNLRALDAAARWRGWRWTAFGGDLVLLGTTLRLLGRGGAPPSAWLLAAVALLLTAGAAGLLGAARRQAGARAT